MSRQGVFITLSFSFFVYEYRDDTIVLFLDRHRVLSFCLLKIHLTTEGLILLHLPSYIVGSFTTNHFDLIVLSLDTRGVLSEDRHFIFYIEIFQSFRLDTRSVLS